MHYRYPTRCRANEMVQPICANSPKYPNEPQFLFLGSKKKQHKNIVLNDPQGLFLVLNIGSIRIYILTTGVVSNETNTYVRMYIEEFILVEIWIHCCTVHGTGLNNIGEILVYIHSQQRIEKCENCS